MRVILWIVLSTICFVCALGLAFLAGNMLAHAVADDSDRPVVLALLLAASMTAAGVLALPRSRCP